MCLFQHFLVSPVSLLLHTSLLVPYAPSLSYHLQALLHRVFSTAVELWREEVGARLHYHNYQRVAACWRAWQLHVLQAQEQRRQAMLGYAADAHR